MLAVRTPQFVFFDDLGYGETFVAPEIPLALKLQFSIKDTSRMWNAISLKDGSMLEVRGDVYVLPVHVTGTAKAHPFGLQEVFP